MSSLQAGDLRSRLFSFLLCVIAITLVSRAEVVEPEHLADLKARILDAQVHASEDQFEKSAEGYSEILQRFTVPVIAESRLRHDRGVAYLRMGDHERAWADFDKALKLDPNFASAMANQGIVLQQKGEHARAALLFSRALLEESDRSEWQLARASIYADLGRWDDVAQGLKEVPEEYNETVAMVLLRARLFIGRGTLVAAVGILQEGIQQFSDHQGMKLLLASSLKKTDQYDAALAVLDQLLLTSPVHNKARHLRGLCLLELKQDAAAEKEFSLLLERDPDRASFYTDRSLARLRLGQYQGALDDCKEALAREPELQVAFYRRGLIFTHLNSFGSALVNLTRALELDPTHADSYFARGFLHDREQHVPPAMEDYSRALKLKPKWDLVLCLRGRLSLSRNEYSAAMKDYDLAIEVSPKFSYAWFLKGRLLEKMSDYQEALIHYDQAMRLEGDDHAQMSRASVRRKFGDLGGATEDFVGLQESESYALDSRIQYAGVLNDTLAHEEAFNVISEALKLDPNSYEAHELLADIAIQLGQAKLAIHELDWMLEHKDQGTDFWALYGKALVLQGDDPGGLDAYNQALDLFAANQEAWFGRAGIEHRLGQDVSALKSYQTFSRLRPNYPEGYMGEARSLQSQLIREFDQIAYESAEGEVRDMALLERSERITLIVELYAEAKTKGASAVEVHRHLVELFMFLRRWDSAEKELIEWLSAEPENKRANELLAEIRKIQMKAFEWAIPQSNTIPRAPSIGRPIE